MRVKSLLHRPKYLTSDLYPLGMGFLGTPLMPALGSKGKQSSEAAGLAEMMSSGLRERLCLKINK